MSLANALSPGSAELTPHERLRAGKGSLVFEGGLDWHRVGGLMGTLESTRLEGRLRVPLCAQTQLQGRRVDSRRGGLSAPPDHFGAEAVFYLASAASLFNILHLQWCRNTCAIGSDRCSFCFSVHATQCRNGGGDMVQLCARRARRLMYSNGNHHYCASTARAHIFGQCDAAFNVRDQVLHSCERRLQVRLPVVQKSSEVLTAS